MKLKFSSIKEPIADFKWQKLFNERWPAYRAWLKSSDAIADASISVAMLGKYMPEMLDTHDHLCRLVRADDEAINFLTGFQPPVYNSACSQAVTTKGLIQLVRNYDYHPDRFEGLLLMTEWNGKKVIANSDCLMGVLDGMNEDGLAVSLTFGGREAIGFGFGIPFILRYVLEFCSNVEEAIDTLLRVPSHMSYNVTVTDKSGSVKTIEIAPDKSAVVTDDPFATNHQGAIEWAENASFTQTAERSAFLKNILSKGVNGATLTNSFLKPPLHNPTFSGGLGTLYTAVYRPLDGMVQMHWPNDSLFQSFDDFTEGVKTVKFETEDQLKEA
ncbi:C45 family autoproteolytic acyltransferase/hydolase [Ekhidna sp.]|uniref:C45 family autoproteolytic acyltransferase/hydolase n=1 Tax=Ekhidna sp. TaxID=2608089 RepID=UPI003B5090AA